MSGVKIIYSFQTKEHSCWNDMWHCFPKGMCKLNPKFWNLSFLATPNLIKSFSGVSETMCQIMWSPLSTRTRGLFYYCWAPRFDFFVDLLYHQFIDFWAIDLSIYQFIDILTPRFFPLQRPSISWWISPPTPPPFSKWVLYIIFFLNG